MTPTRTKTDAVSPKGYSAGSFLQPRRYKTAFLFVTPMLNQRIVSVKVWLCAVIRSPFS